MNLERIRGKMPLIVNNMIMGINKSVEPEKPKVVPPQNVIPVSTPVDKVIIDKNSIAAKTKNNKEHGILFVDGKEKKISKQSQYILDMLSLDND